MRYLDPGKQLVLILSLLMAQVAFCAASAETPEPPSVTAGEGGFSIKSADGAHSLRLRGHLQVDARAYFGSDEHGIADTFILRSARPYLEGTLYGIADFKLMPDFGNGKAIIQDAYVKLHPWAWLQLAAGKMKVPFGLERLQAEPSTYLAERGLPTALSPNRDIGFVLSSELLSGALLVEFGLFDGQADNVLTDGDSSDGKDLVARVFARPFKALNLTGLNGFGIGAAVTWGFENPEGAEITKYNTPGSQTFFKYLEKDKDGNGTATQPDGDRLRVTGQLQYNVAWFGLLAEVVWTQQRFVAVGETPAGGTTLEHLAWQGVLDFALYGGDSSYEGVKPTAPLALTNPGPGAFTLAIRYGELRLDDNTFPTFANAEKAARVDRSYGGALSWWANRNLRAVFDFSRTDFDGGAKGGDRASENIFTTRLQLSF